MGWSIPGSTASNITFAKTVPVLKKSLCGFLIEVTVGKIRYESVGICLFFSPFLRGLEKARADDSGYVLV